MKGTLHIAIALDLDEAERSERVLREEVRSWSDALVGRVVRGAGVRVLDVSAAVVPGDQTGTVRALGDVRALLELAEAVARVDVPAIEAAMGKVRAMLPAPSMDGET